MDLAGFLAVALVVVVTPGPDMALVSRNTLVGGRIAGLATSAGTCSGLVIHASAAALGLSALLLASSRAFTVVKLVGAGYLVFLGLRTFLRAGRREPDGADTGSVRPLTAYRQGVMTNVLNPKVALFFVSLLPQFVQAGEGFVWRLLLLAGLFIAMGLVWLTAYTFALHSVGRFLRRGSIRTAIERVTGAALVALGMRLAFDRN
jgi:threonine/homoserine/homoserine lactone efflux protein